MVSHRSCQTTRRRSVALVCGATAVLLVSSLQSCRRESPRPSSGTHAVVGNHAPVPIPLNVSELWSTTEPMRVGGEVMPPVVVTQQTINFKDCSKQRIAVPFILIEMVITERGELRRMRFLKPVPSCAEEAVTTALNRWRFKPGSYRGKPVSVIYNITINIHYR